MIRIVTDSTCEAPPDLLNNPAVTVVPLHVIFGQDSYQDNIEMTREQFWARLPESDKLPTTSQVTPAQFEVPFKAFTDTGDEVIAITLSAKLSRTYESALLAKDSLPGRAIDVVDSKSISVGLGLVVQQAVEMASAGASRAEIVAKLEQMGEEIRLLFTLQTLEYLQRGGRIGKAQAFMGTLLQFKPLLSIVDGEVHPASACAQHEQGHRNNAGLAVAADPRSGRTGARGGDACGHGQCRGRDRRCSDPAVRHPPRLHLHARPRDRHACGAGHGGRSSVRGRLIGATIDARAGFTSDAQPFSDAAALNPSTKS